MFRNCSTALLLAGALGVGGCTSVKVMPLEDAPKEMCIKENQRVRVSDLLPVIQSGFARHGIETTVVASPSISECPYLVTYTARRSWDGAPYLASTEIVITGPNRETLGMASYHLRRGSWSPKKFKGANYKITPVLNALLKNARPKYSDLKILSP